MTYEEAIGFLEGLYHFADDVECDALNMAIEALEKQIPKKMECYEDKYMHCPKCKEALGYKWKKYPAEKEDFSWLRFCWNCGQKIDG